MTNPVLPLLWIASGAAVMLAAFRSRRDPAAARHGRLAVATLFIVAGAAVNAVLVTFDPKSYAPFADGSYIPFVHHTWRSLVVPHITAWIVLLIAFELAVGLLAVRGGAQTRVAYAAAIAFHLALLSFGFGFAVWVVPMVAALTALWRAEVGGATTEASAPRPANRPGRAGPARAAAAAPRTRRS
ncbi:MAG TPA: hypothetical protein VHC63_06095 [Acidimicrobiales bacterium]|nr:hypothetical protein [Acidimicrobiales bacterium]